MANILPVGDDGMVAGERPTSGPIAEPVTDPSDSLITDLINDPTDSPFDGPVIELIAGAFGLNTSDVAGLVGQRQDAADLFIALNGIDPIGRAPSAVATYEGDMLARIGTEQQFMGGDFFVTVNYANGTGAGRINNLDISGNDTRNRNLPGTDRLSISLGLTGAAGFAGRISGTVSELATAETYTVNAPVSGNFVGDPNPDGHRTGLIGSFDGAVTSGAMGTEAFVGILAGQTLEENTR